MPVSGRDAVCAVLAALLSVATRSEAVDHEFESEINLELQVHTQDALHKPQKDAFAGLTWQTRWYASWADTRHSVTVTPFARFDPRDSGRTHADFRELHWLGVFGDWELLVGASRVFWGKTEFLHLVDIINQTDALENIDAEDKLGQPMIRATWTGESGNLQLYVLPWFRERRFVNERGRFRPQPPVRDSDALYESGAEERHVDAAVRWEGYIGAFDYGVAYFEGTQRTPTFFPDALPPNRLIPFYGQLQQASVDLQYTAGAWLWKLEAVYRKESNRALQVLIETDLDGAEGLAGISEVLGEQGGGFVGGAAVAEMVPATPEFAAATGGFEYSFYGVFDTDIDIGIVAEYMWDERGIDSDTLFQDDLFVATRIAGNDINANTLLAGVVVDLESGSLFYSVEYSRRLGDSASLSAEARVFDNVDGDDRLALGIARDDLVQITLTHYF